MRKEGRMKLILQGLEHYFAFFFLVAFVITCCTVLFVSTLTDTLGITLTEADLSTAAKLTFWNVAFLSLLFTLIDMVRRKLTVERPVQQLTEAAERIVQGDFSVRVQPQGRFGTDGTFDRVIECFNQMAQALGSVETLQTDFIANVSHEMKTPLAVMQNYATLLHAPELSDEKRIEYAKGVINGSRRMADMMRNILQLDRLENQQIRPQIVEFDLGEQLCDHLLQFENEWEKKGIDIDTDIAEGVRVRTDPELLALVWNNLLSNAFKFTQAGGTVGLRMTADDGYAVVQISDTGCGMSPEVGAHIFEKFYQGDRSHSTQGNGLGLALVKRVMDIMRGEISVESAAGKGSVFTVKIRRDHRENLQSDMQ